MANNNLRTHPGKMVLAIAGIVAALLACSRSALPGESPGWIVPDQVEPQIVSGLPTQAIQQGVTITPGGPFLTATPDDPHPVPTMRTEPLQHSVQAGDTMGQIAQRYSINLEELVEANALANPNVLEIGQLLTVPVPTPGTPGPGFKIIPNSELVYSPSSVDFDIDGFIHSKGGYLARFSEEIDDKTYTGAEIVKRIAEDYSVNPRVLLAVLEYQSGWVTQATPDPTTLDFPMNVRDSRRDTLYRQLSWAADNLNLGYYLWRVNGTGNWLLGDGSVVPINLTINPGTAGIQQLFASLYGRDGWVQAVSQEGLFATYNGLFGNPFANGIEPLIPPGLRQPPMQLPFEQGLEWAYTGGPHGAWDTGSAWAALDFAPPAEGLGCIPSNEWVAAVADGVIVRAEDGSVMQDLDNDGQEQTGWAVLYMHIETRDRVQPGTFLTAGERVGHPSCEGGFSSGTHVHIARKYNGEWIPADQSLPFILDGWVSRGSGEYYDGYLEKKGKIVEAYEGRAPDNIITR